MTTLSEHSKEDGFNRRQLVQAAAIGAASAIITPSMAQPLAEATAADYARDPTRWGSAST